MTAKRKLNQRKDNNHRGGVVTRTTLMTTEEGEDFPIAQSVTLMHHNLNMDENEEKVAESSQKSSQNVNKTSGVNDERRHCTEQSRQD